MFSRVITYLVAAVALSASLCASSAIASDFQPLPAGYGAAAEAYVSERLTDPRSARFEMTREPYQVLVDLRGRQDIPCWAVDMRVQSRLPGGAFGGYVPLTVLFYDGTPFALKDDARRVSKIDSSARVAAVK